MAWWIRKPSVEDRLFELLKEERVQQAATMQAMLESNTAQTKILQDYMKMFTDVQVPQIRSMTDADEISTEEKIRLRKLADDTQALSQMPVEFNDLGMFQGQMQDLFNDLKREI